MVPQARHGDDIRALEEELILMEAKLQASYCQMGKSILELAENEQKIVDRLVDDIIQKKKLLTSLKKERQCPGCMTYNTEDSRYCKACGRRLPEEEDDKDE